MEVKFLRKVYGLIKYIANLNQNHENFCQFLLLYFVTGRLRFELLVTNLDDDTIEPMSFSTQDTTFTVPSLPSGTAFQINIQTIGMQSQKDSEVITVRHSTGKDLVLVST